MITRDPTREEFEDIQDLLWSDYTEKFEPLYKHLYKTTGKEPTPALMVRRFRDTYPELFRKVVVLPGGVVI